MFLALIPLVVLFLLVLPRLQKVLGGRAAERERTPSEEGLRPSMQSRVYRLAARLGGRLTVSDVVIDVGLAAGDAERLLDAMVDGLRVRMEITESGVTVYEFPEIRSAESFGHDG